MAEEGTTPLYVRPHELDIDRHPTDSSLAARILHINPAGPLVRVQLIDERTAKPIMVELSRDRFAELVLQPEETVRRGAFARPRHGWNPAVALPGTRAATPKRSCALRFSAATR